MLQFWTNRELLELADKIREESRVLVADISKLNLPCTNNILSTREFLVLDSLSTVGIECNIYELLSLLPENSGQ